MFASMLFNIKTWCIIHLFHHLMFHLLTVFIYHETEGLIRIVISTFFVSKLIQPAKVGPHIRFNDIRFWNMKYHSSWLPSSVTFFTASFIYHELEGLKISGFTQNRHQQVLLQRSVVVGQGNPSHSFQFYPISKREVSFILITTSCYIYSLLLSCIMKQKDLEALVLTIIVISAFFVSKLL